jgi:phosphoglycolate phosphatase/pyrophosphatase PpaX
VPEVIFGWDSDAQKRKPHPYPVLEIMKEFDASAEVVLVVDDLKPGIDMAKCAGVDAAAAGWAHGVPEIRDFMVNACVSYFERVEDFAEFILE